MSPEYMSVEACREKHKESMDLLLEINKRLFKDNGVKSIQTRLNEHERFICIQIWVLGVVGMLLLASLVGLLLQIIKLYIKLSP